MDVTLASRLMVSDEALAAFCRRWRICELSLFGSVLRDDFSEDSDIDVLVTFEPGHEWSLLDHLRMEDELGRLAGRRVEVVSRQALAENPNWVTRQAIAETARRIYAA